jgi:uncharacterized protein
MTARYGLSLYPGLDNSEAENRALLQEAHVFGYGRIFTSLQIPEADRDVLRRQAVTLFQLARDLGFEIMADVSPATVSLFQWPDLTPARITDLGITTVRFDYGIDTATMAAFSRVCRIQCNASTVREEDLQALERAGCDLTRVEGLHNFYPHRYTGLSLDYVRQQNHLLHRYGAHAGMFLAGRHGRRPPLKEGLPTVEAWRDREPADVAEAAWQAGCDFLLLSESRPSREEMERLAAKKPVLSPKEAVRETDTVTPLSGPLVFHVKPWPDPGSSAATAQPVRLLDRLLDRPLSNRPDPAEACIRVAEGRNLFHGSVLLPCDIAAGSPQTILPVGAVLVDNSLYGRYAGETQILLQPRPAESRSTPVGCVAAADLGKLAAVGPGTSFRLVRV